MCAWCLHTSSLIVHIIWSHIYTSPIRVLHIVNDLTVNSSINIAANNYNSYYIRKQISIKIFYKFRVYIIACHAIIQAVFIATNRYYAKMNEMCIINAAKSSIGIPKLFTINYGNVLCPIALTRKTWIDCGYASIFPESSPGIFGRKLYKKNI